MIPSRTSLSIPIRGMNMMMISQPVALRSGRRDMNLASYGAMTKCGCGTPCGGDCGPGMGRMSDGLSGLGFISLDQLINDAFNFGSGTVQSQLPASAAVPPGATGGALLTSLGSWIPYLLVGYLAYKLVK